MAQRWTWALLATLVALSVVFLVALKAEASTGQEIWVEFECVTNQSGETLPMYSVEGRPGAEFTVNDQPVGAVLNGGYGVEGENTWTATPLPGYELTSPNTGVVVLDCGGFETAGGGHPNCERYPQKCDTTTTTTISQETTSTESSSTTSTAAEASTTTSLAGTSTTTSLLASTTTAPSESTTTTASPSSTPSSTDPTVAPADAGSQLPDTGLSHNMWAFLVFAAFVLLTMGGMAVLAGRDDE